MCRIIFMGSLEHIQDIIPEKRGKSVLKTSDNSKKKTTGDAPPGCNPALEKLPGLMGKRGLRLDDKLSWMKPGTSMLSQFVSVLII